MFVLFMALGTAILGLFNMFQPIHSGGLTAGTIGPAIANDILASNAEFNLALADVVSGSFATVFSLHAVGALMKAGIYHRHSVGRLAPRHGEMTLLLDPITGVALGKSRVAEAVISNALSQALVGWSRSRVDRHIQYRVLQSARLPPQRRFTHNGIPTPGVPFRDTPFSVVERRGNILADNTVSVLCKALVGLESCIVDRSSIPPNGSLNPPSTITLIKSARATLHSTRVLWNVVLNYILAILPMLRKFLFNLIYVSYTTACFFYEHSCCFCRHWKYMYRYAKHCHRYDPEWFLNMMLDVGAEELPPTMVGAVIVSMNIVTISFLWFFHVKPLRAALRELNAHL